MIFCNIDHIDYDDLQKASREGASRFLLGGSHMFSAMAHLERQNLKGASEEARNAVAQFNLAVPSLLQLSGLINNNYAWLKQELRDVNPAEAASSVFLPPDPELSKEILRGGADRALMSCAGMANEMSKRLQVLAERAEAAKDPKQFDYTLAHDVLRHWRTTLAYGQQISGICMLFNLAGRSNKA